MTTTEAIESLRAERDAAIDEAVRLTEAIKALRIRAAAYARTDTPVDPAKLAALLAGILLGREEAE